MRSPLCDLVGIEFPIIQAGMSIFTSPGLAAAVSDAGALGSLGAWNRPTDQLQRELAELRDLTERPFAVNHVVPDLNADAFAATLKLPRPSSHSRSTTRVLTSSSGSTMSAASPCNRSRP